ncbi:hypothetical protein, partial [Pseudomonas sp. FSL W5-0299]|uniref:hypothetical protein n=1 Tax=Pseudomonas sp. FSL W5-0299 TaxID=1917484 RepID=UPI001C465987
MTDEEHCACDQRCTPRNMLKVCFWPISACHEGQKTANSCLSGSVLISDSLSDAPASALYASA